MRRPFILFLWLIFTSLSHFAFAGIQGKECIMTQNNNALWTESFGDRNNPAVLLIMGAGAQGISWPISFIEALTNQGYFVIRYDHRDVGQSRLVNYQQEPYTLKDLKEDAISILDDYKIAKAHVVGYSMGGYIAQYMAIENDDRLLSLTSISSTPDHSMVMDALKGISVEDAPLPGPTPELLEAANMLQSQSREQQDAPHVLDGLIHWTKTLYGDLSKGFDTEYWKKFHLEALSRAKDPNAYLNHLPAQDAIREDRREKLHSVNVKALVIHGDKDPIFPLKHGFATYEALPNAQYVEIKGMGHVLSPFFANIIAENLVQHLAQSQESA